VANGEWFAQLYQESYRSLVLTAYALLRDMGEAEEVTQEAFAVAYGRRARVSRTDCPEAWVRKVVVNLARRRWRRRATLDRILRRTPEEPPGSAEGFGEHLDLHAAIRRLSHEHQAAVVLHYLADLPVEDIASILDVPVGTVKSRLSRARTALAAELRTEEMNDA
jgi:RNA polymerase sigma-70 factor (sigma-E family)